MSINSLTKTHTFANGAGQTADATEVNTNFDELVAKVNELITALNTASGTKDSLDDRLDVSISEDGTAKTALTSGGEWANAGLTLAYVGTTSFTASGDHTDIFLQYRRLKVSLSASTVYSEVSSSSYSAGTGLTTVTIADAVIDATMTKVEHAVITPSTGNFSISPNAITPTNAVSATSATTAATATNALALGDKTAATTATADKIVLRDGSGDIYCNALYVG